MIKDINLSTEQLCTMSYALCTKLSLSAETYPFFYLFAFFLISWLV